MMTLLAFISEWSSLGWNEKEKVNQAGSWAPPLPLSSSPGLLLPDTIVHHYCFLGGASNGIVMLEESHIAPGVCEHGIIGQWVPTLHASVAGVTQGQAV